MKAETWVAIYAAIVGTGALLLNFKSWFDSGVKLKLNLVPKGLTIGAGPEFDERDLTILYVTNRGDADTTITNMVLFERARWWQGRPLYWPLSLKWLNTPWGKHYEIAHPQLKGYPPNVPSTLEPSKRWTGAIRYDARRDIIPDLHTGYFYTGVVASHRDRPYLKRIPKGDGLPEGTQQLPD
jgi:hypothetical protein